MMLPLFDAIRRVSLHEVAPILTVTFPAALVADAYDVVARSTVPLIELAVMGPLSKPVETSPVAVRAEKPTPAGTRTR